jgi:hypothetical protein
MKKIMWDLKDLRGDDPAMALYKGHEEWIIARPEKYRSHLLNIFQRLERSWLVFVGKADCFMWPEDKYKI